MATEYKKTGMFHNLATCCVEAWLNGEKFGEIADGLDREVYLCWAAGVFHELTKGS